MKLPLSVHQYISRSIGQSTVILKNSAKDFSKILCEVREHSRSKINLPNFFRKNSYVREKRPPNLSKIVFFVKNLNDGYVFSYPKNGA